MRPFPDGFHFGVATADHQCEAYDDAFGPDIRDLWEQRRGLTPRGRATDFWNRWPEDVKLARELGCSAFRLSLGWARLEREPGVFDEQAFAHYHDALAAIRAAGMATVVTLHHYTWPVHVEERGGMVHRDFPAWFTAYAAEVARRLGPLIDYYVTFNEPNQLIFGYVKPWWQAWYAMPPGLPEGTPDDVQMEHAQGLMRNLFLAHMRARNAIHEAFPAAPVGTNAFLLGLPAWLQVLTDWKASRTSRASLARQGKRFAERRIHELGDADVVIAQLTATHDRSLKVAFSESYLVAHQVVVTKAAGPAIDRAWTGRLAAARGTTAEAKALTFFPHASLVVAESPAGAIELLTSGQADGVLGDDLQLEPVVAASNGALRVATAHLDDEPYAVAVAPGNHRLLDQVDVAIRSFKQQHDSKVPVHGRRTSLAYLQGRQAPGVHRERRDALAGVRKRGRLVAGISPGVPGLCAFDPATKRYTGLEIDLARAIAQQIFGDPEKVEFRVVAMHERLGVVRSRLAWVDRPLRLLTFFSTMLTADWWHLGMQGRLPAFLCPPECRGALDFVGLDYYWGASSILSFNKLLNAAAEKYGGAPVWPGGLYRMLDRHAKMFPGKPIFVVENGCVQKADGTDRAAYLREHLSEVQRAVADGIPVEAYFCWSITSNREWGLPFDGDSDFGLYHIDLDHDPALGRVSTPAAEVYREIVTRRDSGA